MSHGMVRWATTAALFYAFFVWGINYLTGGPTLMDLRRAINVTEAQMGFGFTVTSASNALGALLSGLLYAIFTRHIALAMAMTSMGIASIYLALISRYECFLGLVGVLGLSSGVMATGCNVWILELWGNNQVMIQAMHFWYGVGASLGPLIAEPFLIPENETSFPSAWFKPQDNHILHLNIPIGNGSVPGNGTIPDADPVIDNLLYIPYAISGIMCVLSGLLFLSLYIHILKKRLTEYRQRMRRRSRSTHSVRPRTSSNASRSGKRRNSSTKPLIRQAVSSDSELETAGNLSDVEPENEENDSDPEALVASDKIPKGKHRKIRHFKPHGVHCSTPLVRSHDSLRANDDQDSLLPHSSTHVTRIRADGELETDLDLLSNSGTRRQSAQVPRPGLPPNAILAYVLIGSLLFTVDGFIELANFNYVSVFTATGLHFSKVSSDRISSAMAVGYTVGRAAGIVLALRLTSFAMLVLDGFIMLLASLILYYGHEHSTEAVWAGFILLGVGFASICPTIFACIRRRIPVTDLVGSILVFTPFLGAAAGPLVIEHYSTNESANILLALNVICSIAFVAILPFIKLCDYVFQVDLSPPHEAESDLDEGVAGDFTEQGDVSASTTARLQGSQVRHRPHGRAEDEDDEPLIITNN